MGHRLSKSNSNSNNSNTTTATASLLQPRPPPLSTAAGSAEVTESSSSSSPSNSTIPFHNSVNSFSTTATETVTNPKNSNCNKQIIINSNNSNKSKRYPDRRKLEESDSSVATTIVPVSSSTSISSSNQQQVTALTDSSSSIILPTQSLISVDQEGQNISLNFSKCPDIIGTSSSSPIKSAIINNKNNQNFHIESATVTVPAVQAAAATSFIIKIQLTKMETGNSSEDDNSDIHYGMENMNSSSTNGGCIIVDDGHTRNKVTATIETVPALTENDSSKRVEMNCDCTMNTATMPIHQVGFNNCDCGNGNSNITKVLTSLNLNDNTRNCNETKCLSHCCMHNSNNINKMNNESLARGNSDSRCITNNVKSCCNSNNNNNKLSSATSPSLVLQSSSLDNNLNVKCPVLNLTFTKNINLENNDEITIQSNINNKEETKLNDLNVVSDHNSRRNDNLNGELIMPDISGRLSNSFVNNFATAPFIDDDRSNEQPLIIQCLNNSNSNTPPPESILNIPMEAPWNLGNNSTAVSANSNLHSQHHHHHHHHHCHEVPELQHNQKIVNECNVIGENSTMCGEGDLSHCCRRKKSSSYPSKWRCCQCICRSCKASPTHTNLSEHSNSNDSNNNSALSSTPSTSSNNNNNSVAINGNNKSNNLPNNMNVNRSNNRQQAITVHSSDVAMWLPPDNIIHPETGQVHRVLSCSPFNMGSELVLVTVNYPHSVIVNSNENNGIISQVVEDCDERARRLRPIEIERGINPALETLNNVLTPQKPWPSFMCSPSGGLGPVVHSQVDYIHCLVPDLDKITNSSFYWGKMDRYEAERLLEGKPEGTFLLRDSAQEEYLFSVTFRKYGRSLHARIEQFNHEFSFDCHDPGVFTASTVTSLLEHYKDPSCVMFFEPMLTIPLHRNFPFSLQQLCRAKIASNVTYDGVNELQLPNSLKAYLKEYYYKIRVRVKPFDETFYSCS